MNSIFQATFYVKPRSATRSSKNLNKIDLLLNEIQVRQTVTSILKKVDLPTSYVDSLPNTETHQEFDELGSASKFYEDLAQDFEFERQQLRKKQLDLLHHTDTRRPLKMWLNDNVEAARSKMARMEPVRLQLERLQDELCRNLELNDILWDCG